MTSPDLFDARAQWLTSPVLAFSSWLSSFDDDEKRRLRDGSKTVYISMWSKFMRYLEERGIALGDCQSHHISSFLDFHELKKGHRQRYVRLIEKTYVHLIEIRVAAHNPGAKAGYERVGKGSNDPMRFLSVQERDDLFALLRHTFEAAGEKGLEKDRKEEWTQVRDAVVAATMVGGGLKVSDAVSLTVNCTSVPGRVTVPDEYGQKHTAKLFPIAQDALKAWWPWRERMADGSDLVFTADMKRRRNDKMVKTAGMHPATVYRRVAALLEAAGVTGERACCQTLRNTYAAILIEQGASDAELSECLGLYVDLSAQRMRESYLKWQASFEGRKS